MKKKRAPVVTSPAPEPNKPINKPRVRHAPEKPNKKSTTPQVEYYVRRMLRPKKDQVSITNIGEFRAGGDREAILYFQGNFDKGIAIRKHVYKKGELSLYRMDGSPVIDPTYTYKWQIVYKTPEAALKALK